MKGESGRQRTNGERRKGPQHFQSNSLAYLPLLNFWKSFWVFECFQHLQKSQFLNLSDIWKDFPLYDPCTYYISKSFQCPHHPFILQNWEWQIFEFLNVSWYLKKFYTPWSLSALHWQKFQDHLLCRQRIYSNIFKIWFNVIAVSSAAVLYLWCKSQTGSIRKQKVKNHLKAAVKFLILIPSFWRI